MSFHSYRGNILRAIRDRIYGLVLTSLHWRSGGRLCSRAVTHDVEAVLCRGLHRPWRTRHEVGYSTINGGAQGEKSFQEKRSDFALLTFTAEPAQPFEMHIQNFLALKGEPYFLVSVTSHGKYPLHGARAILIDDERRIGGHTGVLRDVVSKAAICRSSAGAGGSDWVVSNAGG